MIFKGNAETDNSVYPKVLIQSCIGKENCKNQTEISSYAENKFFILLAKSNIYDPESYESSAVKKEIFPFYHSLKANKT